ncbi:MAG: hypothetical protein CEN90_210 [Parcubacteria group bacterium Licking1014_17]|nr:MAG: hypothetical protein CEN90_210 [Parcubacteria group bacterium Licking1014_17]
MKKVAVLLTVLGVIAFTAGITHAATITGITEGSFAKIRNRVFFGAFMDTANTANITHTSVSASSNSGSNVVSSTDDQSATSMSTGNTQAATSTEDAANSTSVDVSVESSNTSADKIETVDAGSEAIIKNKDKAITDTDSTQGVTFKTLVGAFGNTGTNTVFADGTLKATSMWTGTSDSATQTSTVFNLFNKIVKKTIK